MPTGPAEGDRTGVHDAAGRFGLLLVVLIAAYLISAFNGQAAEAALQVVLFAAALLLALRTSPLPRPWPGLMGAAVLAGSAAALGAGLTGTQAGMGLADVWKAVVLLLAAVLIVRRVLARPEITIQSIYGAVSAYLIVGLMFAASYAAIQNLGNTSFFADNQPGTTQTFQYFSFTTLTTLGYGDFTAAGNGGRAIAVMEALAGQVFLATLVARLVAGFRGPASPEIPPPAEAQPPENQPPGSQPPGRWPPPAVRRGSTGTIRPRRRPGRPRRP